MLNYLVDNPKRQLIICDMNITVNGQTYAVPAEKVQDLVAWLNENAARVQENFTPFEGKELLNENYNVISNSGDAFDGKVH
jgi:hypothetical protein